MAADEGDERGFFGEQTLPRPAKTQPAKTQLTKTQPAKTQPGKTPSAKPAPHYVGHRDRLRERFSAAGPDDALADYELLELLLFRLIPRADTKPVAKALLARFGSLSEVLGAAVPRLMEVKGIGASVAFDLKVIAAAARRMTRGAIKGRELLSSWEQVLEYCRATMAFEEREQFRGLR